MSHGASPTYTEAQMLAALNRVYAACGSCSQDDYAALPSEADRSRWILLLAHTLHSGSGGLVFNFIALLISPLLPFFEKTSGVIPYAVKNYTGT